MISVPKSISTLARKFYDASRKTLKSHNRVFYSFRTFINAPLNFLARVKAFGHYFFFASNTSCTRNWTWYTDRNFRLNLDQTDKNFHTETNTGSWWRIWCRFVITTDKKFYTERNTGSWWQIWTRFVITNRYLSQCESFYPFGPNSNGNFSQCRFPAKLYGTYCYKKFIIINSV